MTLLSRLATALVPARAKSVSPLSGIPVDWPINWFQQGRTPTSTSGGSVVESCVQAYAQTIAQLRARHYLYGPDGDTKNFQNGTILNRVLSKPNRFQTRSDFLLNLVYQLLLNGNAYWVGAPGINGERPREIYLLDARVTEPRVVRGSGEIFYATGGAFADMLADETGLIDGYAMIPERYVGHLRLHTPNDPLIGVTPLTAAAASLAANNALTSHQAAFFENMSRPSGFLSSELDLTKEQMERLRANWEAQSTRLAAGGMPILGGGMKYNAMGITSQDAQLVEAWRMTVEDISRVFRVPPMLINNLEKSTFDNAETLMRFWLASGLGFMINHIELAFAAYYDQDDRTGGVQFDQDTLLQADMQARMEALGIGVTKGIYSPNEARAREGLSPVEGGEVPFMQQQNMPINVLSDFHLNELTGSEPPDDDDDDDLTDAQLSYAGALFAAHMGVAA